MTHYINAFIFLTSIDSRKITSYVKLWKGEKKYVYNLMFNHVFECSYRIRETNQTVLENIFHIWPTSIKTLLRNSPKIIMINGDNTTRMRIKISCQTVVSTITKMPDVPQKRKQCTKCQRWNHFLKECKSICEICKHSGVDEYDDIIWKCSYKWSCKKSLFFIDCIAKPCTSVTDSEAFVELNVLHAGLNSDVNCKVDTGSQVNVLLINVFRRMQVSYLICPAQNLLGYVGSPLKSVDVCSPDIDCEI